MKKKIVVIRQPDFLPYIGFFDRLLKSDLYVALDNVQYVSGGASSWTNRDKIKTAQGERWLTVGVQKALLGTNINEMLLLKDESWRRKNLNQIIESYRKAEYFKQILPYLEELYDFQCEKLVDFNLKSIQKLMELLDIRTDVVMASALNTDGKSNQRLVSILKEVEATAYLSGVGARDYFEAAPFAEANIEVIWHEFEHPIYPQLYDGFIPYLSSIDLLFNCGIERSRVIVRGC